MKFDHTVKYGGVYYPPYTEIAEISEKEITKKSKGGTSNDKN